MILGLALAATPAWAVRPTEGGLFPFDDADVVAHWDEPNGRVRVWYAASGPSVVQAGDADADGVPDFVERVGVTTELAFEHTEAVGFRLPLFEADLGLGSIGGSPAFDVYLVDFALKSDGSFGVDACDDAGHCSGFLSMENDFAGYGYSSDEVAIDTLVSHELFHGVQYAYAGGQPVWFVEGMAAWAEISFDPDSADFRRFASAYLQDAGRSLDHPPAGPVPTFAYATGLFWDFLARRHGDAFLVALMEATETPDGSVVDTLDVLEAVLADEADDLATAWPVFAAWNLATGRRAGVAESYPYAADLRGVAIEIEGGEAIDDEPRVFPLASVYGALSHPGGPLWVASDEAAPDLAFSIHAVVDGDAVDDAAATWVGVGARREIADLPAGDYDLAISLPARLENSVKVRLCLGDEAWVTDCEPVDTDPPDTDVEPPGGCACDGGAQAPTPLGLLALVALTAARTGRWRPRRPGRPAR